MSIERYRTIAVIGIGISAFFMGYNLCRIFHMNKIKEVIETNNLVFEEIEQTFDLTTNNSDIIMRMSHYTDKHVEPVLFCPECFNSSEDIDDNIQHKDATTEKLSLTINQLNSDSKEFKDSFARLTSSMANQRFALRHTLDQLRKRAK